jgi:hypothetical protein
MTRYFFHMNDGTSRPDHELNEAREAGREVGVERASIDPSGQAPDEVSAAAFGVASSTIGVLGPEPAKAAGSMEVVVHQALDHDHGHASRHPSLPAWISAEEKVS